MTFLTKILCRITPKIKQCTSENLARIGRRSITFLLTLILIVAAGPGVHAEDSESQINLPVYTNPIDITGFRVQIHVAAPDRNTQKPIDVNLPVGLIGPRMNQLFSTPLSTLLDQQWSQVPDPKTGRTQRAQACDGEQGIKFQVQKAVKQIGSGFSAYEISCNLAPTGKLLVKQVGSTLYLAYLLTANKINFAVTTPGTCKAGNGTAFCANDPRFTVTFASEITTVMRTPDLCHLTAEGATVITQSVNIESNHSLTGSIAKLADDLILGHKFSAAERGIEATEVGMKTPVDGYFQEMRNSDACTGKNQVLHGVLTVFSGFETVIERTAIVFRVSHRGIAAPSVSAPNPGSKTAAKTPAQPSFTRPMIATNRPSVIAGSQVQITGQYFPPNMDFTTSLPITFSPGGSILGGACPGGATELQWGPANAQPHTERLAGDAKYSCATHFEARGLTPGSAYQFRARDCDAITCSPWSALLKVTTATANADQGKVVLTIDGAAQAASAPAAGPGRISALQRSRVAAPAAASDRVSVLERSPVALAFANTNLGSAVVTPQGTFTSTVTIPAGISAGSHTIKAVNGSATAEVAVVVAGTNAGGSKASIMMVGLLRGETGCPNHPISSTQTDSGFVLFGAGFAPGQVTIHLDAPTTPVVGSATPGRDGSFCQQMPGVPGRQAGAHKLVAVQNGAMQTQIPVTFVLPSGVR